jgi:hypothetical protein
MLMYSCTDDTFCSQGELISKPELRRELSEARLLELALLWQRFDIARWAMVATIEDCALLI